MRSTKLLGIILALSVLGIPLAASAGVPTMMNYQGRLTNSAGSPLDGVYHLTFTIFDAAEGGTAKWTEVHPLVNVNGGLFNVTLGNGTPAAPLVDSVFNLPARWLGIQIDGGAELTPRTRILSSGYTHRVSTVDGASGGTIQDSLVVQDNIHTPTLYLGASYQDGIFNLYGDYADDPVVIESGDMFGGYQYLRDETGNPMITAWGDDDGTGAELLMRRSTTATGFWVDGSYNGTENTRVEIQGNARSAVFNMNLTGNSSVALPTDAISASEVFDEPGLASALESSYITLGTSMADIKTVEITTPAAGYVLLIGQCTVFLSGTTSANGANIQIDESAGGSYTFPYFAYVSASAFPSISTYAYPVFVQRIYYKTAGTYTFRLEGMESSTATGTVEATRAILTAIFCPTSYGSVATTVTASDAEQFENVVALPAQVRDGELGTSEPLYQVDLRELELKEARLKAQLEQVQRAIDEAELERVEERLKEQNAR